MVHSRSRSGPEITHSPTEITPTFSCRPCVIAPTWAHSSRPVDPGIPGTVWQKLLTPTLCLRASAPLRPQGAHHREVDIHVCVRARCPGGERTVVGPAWPTASGEGGHRSSVTTCHPLVTSVTRHTAHSSPSHLSRAAGLAVEKQAAAVGLPDAATGVATTAYTDATITAETRNMPVTELTKDTIVGTDIGMSVRSPAAR